MSFTKILSVIEQRHFTTVRKASWFKSVFKVQKNEPPYTHCVQIGDPVLRAKAENVPKELITAPEIRFLVSQMKTVLDDYNLVGIAAPQIGISLRVFLMSFGDHLKKKFTPEVYEAKEMSTFPYTVFINPEIKVLDHKKVVFEETCASIVSFTAEVPRNYKVEVKAFDLEGNEIIKTLHGWNARIAQHEIDHLNGILFTDQMIPKTLRCTNWEVINAKCGRLEIPYYPKK